MGRCWGGGPTYAEREVRRLLFQHRNDIVILSTRMQSWKWTEADAVEMSGE